MSDSYNDPRSTLVRKVRCTPLTLRRVFITSLLAPTVVVGCGGGGDPVDLPPDVEFEVTAFPGFPSLPQGESQVFTATALGIASAGPDTHVTLSLTDQFGGPFDPAIASLSGPPCFPTLSLSGGSGSCMLTIMVGADADPGEYDLRLLGTFAPSGAIDDFPITVTVLGPPIPPVPLGVNVITTGEDLPLNGYEAVLTPLGSTNSITQAVETNQQGEITFAEVESGDYTLELTVIPQNCNVEGENPITIQVGPASNDFYTFTVECDPGMGTLRVTTRTTGTSPDPDGYLVNVGEETIGFSNAPPPGFSHDFTPLPPGDHDVFLFDVALNCVVADAGPPGSRQFQEGCPRDGERGDGGRIRYRLPNTCARLH